MLDEHRDNHYKHYKSALPRVDRTCAATLPAASYLAFILPTRNRRVACAVAVFARSSDWHAHLVILLAV
jgi:hypothetical protein